MLPHILLLPVSSVGSHAVFDLQCVCVCGLRSSVTGQNSVLRSPGKIGYRHPYAPGSTLSHTADRETEMRQSWCNAESSG